MINRNWLSIAAAALLIGAAFWGCEKQPATPTQESTASQESTPDQESTRQTKIPEKIPATQPKPLKKPPEELPTVKLIAISPNNQNIESEFAKAFSLAHAQTYGQRVEIEWNNVGGGGSKILEYLRNIYSKADTAGMDIVWGGGDVMFQRLTADGILQPMKISDDMKANIPATFGGLAMYDVDGYWCGSAVSGFGFLYNATTLTQLSLEPPKLWDDLGSARFFGLVALADPTQSASAATANEMIVQSGNDWPSGWAKLLAVLSNAKRFYDGASTAADAVIAEAPIAACIDFYGAMRVAKYPEDLVYVNPVGQTAFNPDPIGILKNPPNPELAQRFIDFVLSAQGQALWACKVGTESGPVEYDLMRLPIRKDVYEKYAPDLSPWISNPYLGSDQMKLDVEVSRMRANVLPQLVKAAAIDNIKGLKKAKAKLIETNFEAYRMMDFNLLPNNLATLDLLAETARRLTDETQGELIVTQWQRFFADKYERISK